MRAQGRTGRLSSARHHHCRIELAAYQTLALERRGPVRLGRLSSYPPELEYGDSEHCRIRRQHPGVGCSER